MPGSGRRFALAIILLIFGGAKLPKLALFPLGQAQKEFKDGVAEGEESVGSDPAQPAPHKSEGNACTA